MKYEMHYNNLINRALSRNLCVTTYVELHHIIPKCLGGVDRKSNIVKLTPEEHYIAHQLLVKMHPGHAGLKYALYKLTLNTATTRRNNKQYAWVKKQLAVANKMNSIKRWENNQKEKDVYSARTKKQWKDMSEEDYKTACQLRSDNQTGSGNSFYQKSHKKESKDKISEFRSNYYNTMTDEERIDKIPQLRQVSINGVIYPGLSFAARQIGIGASLLHYRINSKSKKWVFYSYID